MSGYLWRVSLLIMAVGTAQALRAEPYKADAGTMVLFHLDGRTNPEIGELTAPSSVKGCPPGQLRGLLSVGPDGTKRELTPTWIDDGRYGKALRFKNKGARVFIEGYPRLAVNGPFSVEAWIRWDGTKQDEMPIFDVGGGNWRRFYLGLDRDGVPHGIVYLATGIRELFGDSAVGFGAWTHLALAWNGREVQLLVNGKEVAKEPADGPLSTSAAAPYYGFIGYGVQGNSFNGDIDEVRLELGIKVAYILDDKP